jgi:hypothetical protein
MQRNCALPLVRVSRSSVWGSASEASPQARRRSNECVDQSTRRALLVEPEVMQIPASFFRSASESRRTGSFISPDVCSFLESDLLIVSRPGLHIMYVLYFSL